MEIFLLLLLYPMFMGIFWIVGTTFYFIFFESRKKKAPNKNIGNKGITFLIPCYNEEETIKETIDNIINLEFPNKEIIVVNDGSTDATKDVIESHEGDFKFINLEVNKGKANALNESVLHATYDYIMCIDADTIIEEDAPYYMLENFERHPNIGAVTGNPRIRNKSSILGKIQAVEYASMIGSIKRSQSIVGTINTVSGVFTLFRRKALEKVNYWDTDMITEDIAVSWKLHLNNFSIKYEPRALCWMLVPETVGGLWKQRIRWAQGGHEVLIRDLVAGLKSFNYGVYLLLFEQVTSLIWIHTIVISMIITILNINFLDFYFYRYKFTIFLLSSFVLTFINLIQFIVSLLVDSRYEKVNIITLFFLSWYPTFYWIINALVAVIAFPRALKRKKGVFATWTSPDRGNIKR